MNRTRLTKSNASIFARIALDGVIREYPNKPEHLFNSRADARTPRQLHPAFYGCYDWHSAVHSHWMLLRILRMFPGLPESAEINAVLNTHFSGKNIAAELDYIQQPGRTSFERPYGWAWMFKLVQEIAESNDPDLMRWLPQLKPLADVFAARMIAYLPLQHHAIRTGVHSNTAFALGFAWDYAKANGNAKLAATVETSAQRLYGSDRDAPARWEPSGNDFFSPSLIEADLMRRLLNPQHFARWLEGFLPGLATGQPQNLLTPTVVSDRKDPQGVHLDGLNISRAWCMHGIANVLHSLDSRQAILRDGANAHLEAGISRAVSGDFLGEHWLGTFAVFALTS